MALGEFGGAAHVDQRAAAALNLSHGPFGVEREAAATGGVSREAWAMALLGRLQAPVCANNLANWCRGCAGGAYVIGLLPAVRANYAAYSG